MQNTGIITLLYGQPSAGKTTLATTAGNVLLLDFDRGAHRAAFPVKDVKQFNSWEEYKAQSAKIIADLPQFDALVVDTVGALVGYIEQFVIKNDYRLGSNTIKMYGEIKKEFNEFLFPIRNADKNVIFIAHEKEEQDNGQGRSVRPLIPGSSKDTILQAADMVGYVFNTFKGKCIDFNGNENRTGKNCAGLPLLHVPDIYALDGFMQGIIKQVKDSLAFRQSANFEAIKTVARNRAAIDKLATLEEYNSFYSDLAAQQYDKPVRVQIWVYLKAKAETAGYVFNAESKHFDKE